MSSRTSLSASYVSSSFSAARREKFSITTSLDLINSVRILRPLVRLEIELNALLTAVAEVEIHARVVRRLATKWSDAPPRMVSGAFDENHLCTQASQSLARIRTREKLGDVDDPDSREWPSPSEFIVCAAGPRCYPLAVLAGRVLRTPLIRTGSAG